MKGAGWDLGEGQGLGDPCQWVLMELCVAVWAGEEGSELEEEEVEVEEEEESGSLDEEEMKKMQSDEVCGDGPKAPLPFSAAEPLGWGTELQSGLCAILFSILPSAS